MAVDVDEPWQNPQAVGLDGEAIALVHGARPLHRGNEAVLNKKIDFLIETLDRIDKAAIFDDGRSCGHDRLLGGWPDKLGLGPKARLASFKWARLASSKGAGSKNKL